ncbi:hypothetical protein AA313_de0208520 [Arthrobotrys entomopaga]|nr:hypothetical protein AA313_de0208520 [Arthrobotrys entomopaga]
MQLTSLLMTLAMAGACVARNLPTELEGRSLIPTEEFQDTIKAPGDVIESIKGQFTRLARLSGVYQAMQFEACDLTGSLPPPCQSCSDFFCWKSLWGINICKDGQKENTIFAKYEDRVHYCGCGNASNKLKPLPEEAIKWLAYLECDKLDDKKPR